MERYIIDKYKKYKITPIQSGFRCKTYILENDINKYIYQVYMDNTKYQAKKKKYITSIIKSNVKIAEIPEVIDYGENDEFSYLVTEFKKGEELDKISNDIFNSNNFYNSLSQILNTLHNIEIGNKFRMDRTRRIRTKRQFL